MVDLLNGCSCSAFKVTPKNWDSPKASMSKPWRIHYRFYDPSSEIKVKQVTIRGMNREHVLKERQRVTRALLEDEKRLIDVEGYNPITDQFMTRPAGEITAHTHFIPALETACKMLPVVHPMKLDIESMIRGVKAAAEKLYDNTVGRYYADLQVSQVRRKHLVYILEQCKKDNPRFSNYRQNKYRGFLLMLFKKLLILEAVDTNPAKDIPIEKHTFKKRKLLTPSERLIIDTNLKASDYYFWRYMRIFFRSGSRSSELLSLKNGGDINLEAQEFTITVKKGKHYREEIRPIPGDIMSLWQEVMDETPPGEYLFSTGFRPGPVRIGNDNPNKRWKKKVKEGMGIDKDFYSLKALNADVIDELKGLEYAAAADGHADSNTTRKHYAVNNEKRLREELKKITVDFV